MPQTPNVSQDKDLEQVHRLHSYCARFPSEIAEEAIRQYTRKGESVYDPFCGSGTSLSAGLLLGRHVVGSDIDVLAGMLSSLKCAPATPKAYAEWKAPFERALERAFSKIDSEWPSASTPRPGEVFTVGGLKLQIPSFPELNYWFPPQLVALLAAVAEEAHNADDEHLEQVALVSLSASIIAKWPNTLSYAMDVDHTRPHRVIQRFYPTRVLEAYKGRLARTIASLSLLRRLYEEAGVLATLRQAGQVICPHDARQVAPGIDDESQALVVTSPPYFNAVDYPRAHRLSVCWMNGRAPEDLASRKQYVGIRHAPMTTEAWLNDRGQVRRMIPTAVRSNGRLAKIAGFFSDLDAATAQIWRVLRPGGHAVVVIADNRVKGHLVKSHGALIELAKGQGFELVTRHSRRIDSLRRRFPVGTFGFDGPMTHEHIVVLRRPKRKPTVRAPKTPRQTSRKRG